MFNLNSLLSPLAWRWYLLGALVILLIRIILTAKRRLPPKAAIIITPLCLMIIVLALGIILLPQPQLLSPKLPLFSPLNLDPATPLVLRFNRPISRRLSAALQPQAAGVWRFGRGAYGPFPDRLLFYPDQPLDPNLEYTLNLHQILPLSWVNLEAQAQSLLFVFKPLAVTAADLSGLRLSDQLTPILTPSLSPTPNPTPQPESESFRLPVPLFKQHHTFTCYTVAAKMALAYRDVTVDEVGFLDEIGYQTVKRNYLTNNWGNPNLGVVGTFNGAGDGGYGAHWQPVAEAISHYRAVEVKQNWPLSDLLRTVKAGNPVMVWWVNGVWPAKDVSWNTPEGPVYTVNGMHVEVVTGYLGTPDQPQSILTNDPWRGQRRYPPDVFLSLWRWFNQTAVIVY
ncbi:hypothetical protein A2W24_06100 [Microgenomates group bacterium RBG_16_45_19]|nr:MAG: hypothetical protein A2W24_06100 [Microgenomates group bacterium RBG_16_45_19]